LLWQKIPGRTGLCHKKISGPVTFAPEFFPAKTVTGKKILPGPVRNNFLSGFCSQTPDTVPVNSPKSEWLSGRDWMWPTGDSPTWLSTTCTISYKITNSYNLTKSDNYGVSSMDTKIIHGTNTGELNNGR